MNRQEKIDKSRVRGNWDGIGIIAPILTVQMRRPYLLITAV
jgi:hypothetical protein